MKIPQLIRAEFARLWATPMARLAFVALMCVPLLYGGLYLWANQDPYARLDQVPVALVVADEGVQHGDTVRSVGDEVAKNLIEDGSFDWKRVSAKQAAEGVESGLYDFSVTLPEDFTQALESSRSDDPHQADVVLTTNDANSYLASTIGEQAVKRIQQQIVRSVNQEAARTMLDGIAEIRVSLVDASDGSAQLLAGTEQARAGAGQLVAGLGQLRDGTANLPAQTEALAGGAAQVSAGNAQIAEIGNRVAGASQQAVDRLAGDRDAIIAELQAAGVDPAVIASVDSRLAAADPVLRDANTRVQSASAQLNALASGSQQLAGGARQLADATPQLTAGIATAADGAGQLDTGLGALVDGASRLHDGLAGGVERIPDSSDELRGKQAANIADPVDVRTSQVTSAGTYGAGLAPFFVSLAAWIGIYALFLILKPVSRRAVTAIYVPIRVTIAGWATPALLGAVQMLALFGIVAGVLGFGVTHPVPAYGMMALASAAFAAIILALNIWLGSVGQFMGLVLMVLQLVTAGGTFPWQTLPEPLSSLHHYLPMSFAVDGLRQLMYGGVIEQAGSAALKLGLVLVIALLVSALGVARMMRSRTLRDLQPSLIG